MFIICDINVLEGCKTSNNYKILVISYGFESFVNHSSRIMSKSELCIDYVFGGVINKIKASVVARILELHITDRLHMTFCTVLVETCWRYLLQFSHNRIHRK